MPGKPLTQDSPGSRLIAARESAGIDQREVADALNLPVSTVDAIEQNDAERLPALVFARGYVRAYAKLLELDPDPLVAALSLDNNQPHEVDDGDAQPSQSPEDLTPSAKPLAKPQLSVRGLSQITGVALGAFVLIGLLIWVFGTEEPNPSPDGGATASAASTPPAPKQEAGQTETSLVGESQSPQRQAPVQQPALSSQDVATAASAQPASTTIPAAPQNTIAVATDPTEVEVEPSAAASSDSLATRSQRLNDGDDRLWLEFSEDCWVEIKDMQGVALFGDLGRAGQSLEFAGAGPFRILLGYAPGALLRYNDEAVALAPHTRNNVATLVIGQ